MSVMRGRATDGTITEVVVAPSWNNSHGVAGIPFTSSDQHSAAAAVTSVPTSGQKLVVTDLLISTDTLLKFTFTEETSGTVIAGPFYLLASTTLRVTGSGKGWKLPTADKRLMVQTSAAGNVMVEAQYYSEA